MKYASVYNCSFHNLWFTSRLTLKVTHHVTQSYFKKAYKNKKDQESFDSQPFPFCRDYCPTSRKIHLILLNSRIFYVV